MTELSFLVDLLLNHKLAKATKDAVAARIKEVEAELPFRPTQTAPGPAPVQFQQTSPAIAAQPWASTQAAMARHENSPVVNTQAEAPQPVTIVAHTPAAIAAMASRNQAIADSMAGKVDKQTGRPRKF